MMDQEEREYYDRHIRLEEIGVKGQELLKEARVLVVGMGGLGCPVGQYLAAAGVGRLTLIDPDKVSASNLHRQILYGIDDIGRLKSEVACEKLASLNPHIELIPVTAPFQLENALELVAEHDVVIDCTDNFSTRYLINDACVIQGKPFIYGAISKFSGQVSVFNLNNGPTYRCLFPEYPDPALYPACGEVGVLGVLPGLIGTIQATECVKLITGVGETLSGKVLMIDTKSMSFRTFTLKVSPFSGSITELIDYRSTCEINGSEVTWEEWQEINNSNDCLMIDVRSEIEHQEYNPGGVLIPLDELKLRLNEIPRSVNILVYCKSGLRSATARNLLLSEGYTNVTSLKGGVDAIS